MAYFKWYGVRADSVPFLFVAHPPKPDSVMINARIRFSPAPHQTIEAILGDLTAETTDAIINPANSRLQHGDGVAGILVARGGHSIQEISHEWVRQNGPLPVGQAMVTPAGNLPCKWIIHTVGPIWNDGNHQEPELLEQAIWNALLRAHELALQTVSMPAVSSGIFGFPKKACAKILIDTAIRFWSEHPDTTLEHIRMVNIDEPTFTYFKQDLLDRNSR